MKESDAFIIALAELIAPDEVDTAPALLAAAARGGEDWRQALHLKTGTIIGGWIGPAEYQPIMAYVIDAVQASWPVVQFALEASVVGIHVAELAHAIRHWVAGAKATAEAEAVLPRAVISALEGLRDELRRHGVEAGRAAELAGATVEAMAVRPEAGAAFMQAVRPT